MGRTIGRTLFVISLLILSIRLATAADSIDLANRGLQLQTSGDSRQAIDLYSQALEQGDLPDGFLAALYNNLAAAYTKEGQYDLALQDYAKSLELDPESVPVLNNRGALYAKMGHFTRAIVDYSECLRLKPDFGKAYSNRGNAQFYLRRFDGAIDDYFKALQFNTGDRYRTVIWLYLARLRLGVDGRDELRANLRALPKDEWPAPVGQMYLGELTPNQMLASAVSDDPVRDRERKAEALFYLGYYALLQGDSERAFAYFRRMIQSDVHYLVEFTGARAELGLAAVALESQPSLMSNSATPGLDEPPGAKAQEASAAPLMPVARASVDSDWLLGKPVGATSLLSNSQSAPAPVLSGSSQPDQTNGGATSSFGQAVAALKEAPAPTAEGETAGTESADELLIHLMSLKSKRVAEDSAERLRRRFPDLMGPDVLKIRRVDLGDDGIVYRIVAGPYASRDSALGFCEEVHKRSGDQYCQLLTY